MRNKIIEDSDEYLSDEDFKTSTSEKIKWFLPRLLFFSLLGAFLYMSYDLKNDRHPLIDREIVVYFENGTVDTLNYKSRNCPYISNTYSGRYYSTPSTVIMDGFYPICYNVNYFREL